ncbi:MAG TPA: SRPBCC domain-containing protein [Actinomycetes bacterium]|nr:SRPBCC domain-containing protein [Actinomycetes bacterium]
MAKQLRAQIDIHATPERVWQVLTDFGAYPKWNPFITRAEGSLRRGERLTVRLQPVGGRGMTFRPTVLEATPAVRLRWLGHLLVTGVFDGEHSFTIQPLGGGRVRLVQQEDFHGLLVPLLAGSLDRRTLPAFERMNQALKRRAERPEPEAASRDHRG